MTLSICCSTVKQDSLDMKIEIISMVLLLTGFVSCSPAWRSPASKYGTNYYSRLNLDKIKSGGVFEQHASEAAVQTSFSGNAGRGDNGNLFAEARLSAAGEKNTTLAVGAGDAHAGGDIVASGRGDLSTKVEAGKGSVGGEVGGAVNGSLIAMGSAGNNTEGSIQVTGEADGKLSVRGAFPLNTGGKVMDGELSTSGRGSVRGDVSIESYGAGANVNTLGEGKVSADVAGGIDNSGAYVGGELETVAHGKVSADGGLGEYRTNANVDGSGAGKISGGASFGKTDKDIHAGGELDASGSGKVSSNLGQGFIDIQGSGDGSLNAGGEIGRDDNQIYAGGVAKSTSQGDLTSRFGLGEHRGEGHVHVVNEDQLIARIGTSKDEDGMRASGDLEGKKNVKVSSETKLGDHFGYSSVAGVGNYKTSTAVELTSNDTEGHANTHLGGVVDGNVISTFGVDKLRGGTDTSGMARGNITGDAIVYSDETGAHANAEGKAVGKVGFASTGNIGTLHGTSDAIAKGETKVGAGAELVSDDYGVRAEMNAKGSNQGMFDANTSLGNVGSLTGYGNIHGDGGSNVTFITGVGENTNNTLYARSQIVGSTGGRTSGSVGIGKNSPCRLEDGVQCQDGKVVFADAGVEGKGKVSGTAGVALTKDDSVVAAEEIRATGHGKLSGDGGIGNLLGSGDVGVAGDGKVYGRAGLVTDDEGGVKVVAEKGTKGKANITSHSSIGGVKAHADSVVEGDGKVFTGTYVTKDKEGGVHFIGDIGSEAIGSLNSSAGIGELEGRSGVRGATGSKVTVSGDYVRNNGSVDGRGEINAQSGGRAGAGVDLGKYAEGTVGASGHGDMSAESDVHKSQTGDIEAGARVGGSLGGSLSADGRIDTLGGGTGVHGGAEGSIQGKFTKSKEHGIHASTGGKISTSSGFRFKFWG